MSDLPTMVSPETYALVAKERARVAERLKAELDALMTRVCVERGEVVD